jgi:hypothetical protein
MKVFYENVYIINFVNFITSRPRRSKSRRINTRQKKDDQIFEKSQKTPMTDLTRETELGGKYLFTIGLFAKMFTRMRHFIYVFRDKHSCRDNW